MVCIMTINLVMNTKLIGVRVGGSGIKGIKTILFFTKPTTFPTFIFCPYFQEYDKKPTTNF
jgi:hypothetical protein